MLNVERKGQIMSSSDESTLEEFKHSFENLNENNPYFSKDDIPQEQIYFIETSTIEFSNNKSDNITEKNKSENACEGYFSFIRDNKEFKESDETKINKFLTKKHKKRGRRKMINTNRKTHSKTDDDNVLTKIQNHFLTFLVDISNDVIKSYFEEEKINKTFMQIDYNIKKNIKLAHISELKTRSIKDILQMKVSPRNKNIGEDYNKEVYEEVYKLIYEEAEKDENLNWINDFFDTKYLEAFKKYYYYFDKNRNYFLDKKINFSLNTKPYYKLLEKYPEIKDSLKKICERCFIGINKPYQKIFMINKIKN